MNAPSFNDCHEALLLLSDDDGTPVDTARVERLAKHLAALRSRAETAERERDEARERADRYDAWMLQQTKDYAEFCAAIMEAAGETGPATAIEAIHHLHEREGALRAHVERLREALDRYGEHDMECPRAPDWDGVDPRPEGCTCGLWAALAATPADSLRDVRQREAERVWEMCANECDGRALLNDAVECDSDADGMTAKDPQTDVVATACGHRAIEARECAFAIRALAATRRLDI